MTPAPRSSDETKLPEGERRFRRLVNVLDHTVVWELDDSAGKYTFVSEHSHVVLGFPCTEWVKDAGFFESRFLPGDVERFRELLAKLRAGDNDLRLEHRCIKADGSIVWLHTGVHRDDENGAVLLRGVTIDITNLKIAEERERAAKEEAERTARAYEEMMAIISHDLRSPLQSISLGAVLLGKDPAAGPRVVSAIERSAKQMQRLIEDLTDLSQVRTRKLKISPTQVSTDEILRETFERFRPIAAERGVAFEALDATAHTVLRCDAKRIAQVLGNLVSNAIKFSKPGPESLVSVSLHVDPLEATFCVRDRGPGIAPDDLARVFDREWQARETADLGSGLGLYIAKGIVEAHAGRIWVESTLHEGATFRFTVPLG